MSDNIDKQPNFINSILDKKFTKANSDFGDMMRNKVYAAVNNFKQSFKYVTHKPKTLGEKDMKQFKTFLAEAAGLKSSMKFGGETFKLERDKGKDGEWVSYYLQGKYKGALYIQVEEEEKMVVLNMDIGNDKLEDWIDDVKKKVGEKKWPEDSEGQEQEKYFDNKIIKKIWDDAEKQFKKLGYEVELGD